MRPVTLFTGQWAALPLDQLARKAAAWGYKGLELACWGDHFDVRRALEDKSYCQQTTDMLERYGLQVFAISNHLVGQAVCANHDPRNKGTLPPEVWGDGDPEGVRKCAAERMKDTVRAAAVLGVKVVNGFTGSSIWHMAYPFPPVTKEMIDAGYQDFARRWLPILDVCAEVDVKFALEVHPSEIAFDIASAERALEAVGGHPAFGFNYDPSHLAYQKVDYVGFIRRFADRIFHVHMKDVAWGCGDGTVGVFGGHVSFGDPRRYWDFRSLGHGNVNFEAIIRALNDIGYTGPLSVEWEDSGMDREHGAVESCRFVRALDFPPSAVAFDAAFDQADKPAG